MEAEKNFEKSDPLVKDENVQQPPVVDTPSDSEIRKLKDVNRKSGKCQECHKSYKYSDALQRHMLKHHPSFKCDQCDKKFLHKDELTAHVIKDHCSSIKKVEITPYCPHPKAVDINRCKPNGIKIIQCMICLRKFANFSELKTHLLGHAEISAFTRRTESIAEIAESFYPDLKIVDANQLLAQIRKDIADENLAHFYSITNQSGYELDLNSSETDSDDTDENDATETKESESTETGENDATEIDENDATEIDENDATEIDENDAIETKESESTETDKNDPTETGEIDSENQQERDIYSCDLCNSSFSRKYQIFEHQRTQHSWLEAQHVCVVCKTHFVSEGLLEHHLNTLCKNVAKRFICKKCPIRFRWRHNLGEHTQDHINEIQPIQCSYCELTFQDQRSLTIHTRSEHADELKLIECQCCTQTLAKHAKFGKLLNWQNLTANDTPRAESLLAATTNANGTKRIFCKICYQQFSRIKELREHILIHLPSGATTRDISTDNYSITNKQGFELHIDDSETEDDAECNAKENHSSAPKYSCDICQIKCRRKYQLCRHQHSSHSFSEIPHECDKCIFRSVSKDILEHHKVTQCLNTEKRLFCEKCKYKFMWPINLKLHERLYHINSSTSDNCTKSDETKDDDLSSKDSKKPDCIHCPKRKKSQSPIKDVPSEGNRNKKDKARRRKHPGEGPFICSKCDKGFVRMEKYKRHLLSHSGQRPLQCTFCGGDYRHKCHLDVHLLKHIDDPAELLDE